MTIRLPLFRRGLLDRAACLLLSAAALSGTSVLEAQISLTSAADLALRNSPRVKMAEADVDRARAALAESHAIYIPTVNGTSAGLGYGYGFPLGTPTLYGIQTGSLVYSASQSSYLKSAREGLVASTLTLRDVREQVLEDVTVTYLALSRGQRERAAMEQELSFAQHLEAIVQDRLDAGQDTPIELTRARRTAVQLRLNLLQMDDEIASNQDHLARLTGLSGTRIETLPNGVPEVSLQAAATAAAASESSYDTPAVLAAMTNAQAKQDQAIGDNKFLYRPVFSFGAQYSKFSTYNNAYTEYYPTVQSSFYTNPVTGALTNSGHALTSEAFGFSVNVTVPVLDRARHARAEIALAEAARARHEADFARDNELELRLRLRHTNQELGLRAQLAALDRDLAQEQLDAILVQLQYPPTGGAPPITPKEEQNARISERQHFVDMIDAEYQLLQAEVNLLRQTGGLEDWLKSAVTHP
jgi:outer membrane protein TolC